MQPRRLATTLLSADARVARRVNHAVRRSAAPRIVVGGAATWFASVEVLLIAGLALSGGLGTAVRMLFSVGAVYLASEGLGKAWPRQRPFAHLVDVEALVPHAAERSFPSRHMASGIAIATVAGLTQPTLGRLMWSVAWLLGLSRVAAGLHYPSDVLAGAVLGTTIGRLLRRRAYSGS